MAEFTCDDCGREFGMAAHLASHRKFKHPTSADDASLVAEATAGADEPGGGAYSGDEATPGAKPSAVETTTTKVRSLFAKRDTPGKPAATKEARPKLSFRRQSTAGIFEFAWSQGGNLLMMGPDVPVGRVMALQAPMVGDVLDDAIKGTVIDKVLQPFVRQGTRAKLIGAVVLPPLIVGAMERNPELAPTMMPMLRACMIPMLVEMAKAAKKAKADEKKLMEALDEIADSLPPELFAQAREEGVHPVDALIASIFAPPPEPSSRREAASTAAA